MKNAAQVRCLVGFCELDAPGSDLLVHHAGLLEMQSGLQISSLGSEKGSGLFLRSSSWASCDSQGHRNLLTWQKEGLGNVLYFYRLSQRDVPTPQNEAIFSPECQKESQIHAERLNNAFVGN